MDILEKIQEKDLNFEDKLWKVVDKLRKKIGIYEYKQVVLELIFLRYLSFASKRVEYIIDIPENADWDYIKKNASQPNIGEIIDKAIKILENEFRKIKDVVPKICSKVNLNSYDFTYLINLFSEIEFDDEYFKRFLGKFTDVSQPLTKLIEGILGITKLKIFNPIWDCFNVRKI